MFPIVKQFSVHRYPGKIGADEATVKRGVRELFFAFYGPVALHLHATKKGLLKFLQIETESGVYSGRCLYLWTNANIKRALPTSKRYWPYH